MAVFEETEKNLSACLLPTPSPSFLRCTNDKQGPQKANTSQNIRPCRRGWEGEGKDPILSQRGELGETTGWRSPRPALRRASPPAAVSRGRGRRGAEPWSTRLPDPKQPQPRCPAGNIHHCPHTEVRAQQPIAGDASLSGARRGSRVAGNLQDGNLGELCPGTGRGWQRVSSTSKLAAEGRRVREQARVQRTKFPGESRSLELPERSRNRQQWGIQMILRGTVAARSRRPGVG